MTLSEEDCKLLLRLLNQEKEIIGVEIHKLEEFNNASDGVTQEMADQLARMYNYQLSVWDVVLKLRKELDVSSRSRTRPGSNLQYKDWTLDRLP